MTFHQTQRIKVAISLIVALILCLTLAVPSFAEGGGSLGEGLTWRLDGTALTVEGSGAIPDYSDANMPPWYKNAADITSVTVSEGITGVGSLSFYNLPKLTAVTLPSTLETIGDRAFKDCVSLSVINFPSGLKTVGEASFENCASLISARLPEGLTDVGNMAFYHCVSLSSVTVPSTVKNFGKVVFSYCTGLVRAEINCPVTKLPYWTFYGCSSLISVSLPDELTEVGEDAFHDCESLSAVHYAGKESESVYSSIASETRIMTRGGMTAAPISEQTSAYVNNGSEYVTVSDTDNAVITVRRTVTGGIANPVGRITAVISNGAGWEELASVISEMIIERTKRAISDTITASVQLSSETLNGAPLADLVGEPVSLYITTGKGARWMINLGSLRRDSIAAREYSLAYTVTDVRSKPSGLVCSRLYRLNVAYDVDFSASVALPIGSSYARRYASLFKENDEKHDLLDSVIIDTDGVAWFSALTGEMFYVAIDVEGVWAQNARVPSSLQGDYGVSDGDSLSYLMDADGNRFAVGERTSRWGISGWQFAVMIGGVMFLIIVVVTAVMIIRNHSAKLRAARGVPPKKPKT